MCKAIDLLDALLSASIEPFPVPVELRPAQQALVAIGGYSAADIRGALRDIARTKTAQCTAYIHDDDRDAIEAVLPGNPWLWPAWTDATIQWTGVELDTDDEVPDADHAMLETAQ